MKYLRMVWRFMTLDDRLMDENWRPITGGIVAAGIIANGKIYPYRVPRKGMGDDLRWACCDAPGPPCQHKKP